MTPDQMVSALTYRAEGETLADRIDTIREDLGAIGYGDIPSITIFRSILAVAGEEDVQNARWDRLASRVKGRLADAVENTDKAIRLAVGFLRDQCGVPLAFRSARVRAYILWELRRFEGRIDLGGDRIDGVDLLARSHTTAYQHVVLGEPSSSHPANRVILPTAAGISARSALLSLYPDSSPLVGPSLSGEPGFFDDESNLADATLASHGVPWEAMYRLAHGDSEGFIRARADFLAARERSFIIDMGIEPAAEAIGEADIDTE